MQQVYNFHVSQKRMVYQAGETTDENSETKVRQEPRKNPSNANNNELLSLEPESKQTNRPYSVGQKVAYKSTFLITLFYRV